MKDSEKLIIKSVWIYYPNESKLFILGDSQNCNNYTISKIEFVEFNNNIKIWVKDKEGKEFLYKRIVTNNYEITYKE